MICTRLLNYKIPACRQAMMIVGRNKSCLQNNLKIASPLLLKRNLYESPKCKQSSKDSVPKPAAAPGSTESSSSDGSGGNSSIKWIVAALAAAGLGGGAWYLLGGDGKSDDQSKDQSSLVSKRVPLNGSDLPKKVPYLLVGGGAASFSAFRAIKSNDPKAKVLVISNEFFKPYMRPPLSKELWYASEPGVVPKDYRFKQWTGAERSLFFEPDEFFIKPTNLLDNPNGGIAVAQGYAVKKIDPKNRVATLDDGTEIQYEKCLLATGCTPKNLPAFENAPKNVQDKIMFYRSPNDFEKLKKLVDENKSITIVGNGFLGSELACSLATYSKDTNVKINQIYAESANMSKVLPEYLSKWTTQKVEQLGVCVVPGVQVKEVNREQSGLKLALSNGQTVLTDVAVVCVGCEANTNIATLSGLEVDDALGGFVVNAELEARQDLFAAGDASCFYDPLLGRRRLEHHDHSVISGRLAGENMVGKDGIKKPYEHQSMFWSDLGPGIGYEGIGRTESSLPTVGVFALKSDEERKDDHLEPTTESSSKETTTIALEQKPKDTQTQPTKPNEENDYQKGVIFYLQNDKIVGILLWNIFNRVGLARTIINQNKSYEDLNEVAKLFEIHS
ncbi:putative apoptosis-inducing factor 1, mitochondrial isoform X2 [Episyrphus balteatus]|uniref:putative apoptosis-inducing factor 1, mitochondrial isoform X2 n=1 Tax=Episyrphus balteatus TaxID=286459 RepID=UPI002485942D|nr:putative apoptosis-inducing factor 1, mitochondrial isoform X2 [Episyrphus balteatus]